MIIIINYMSMDQSILYSNQAIFIQNTFAAPFFLPNPKSIVVHGQLAAPINCTVNCKRHNHRLVMNHPNRYPGIRKICLLSIDIGIIIDRTIFHICSSNLKPLVIIRCNGFETFMIICYLNRNET